jgi:cytoskeletal protein CcmA (bactofilin family)
MTHFLLRRWRPALAATMAAATMMPYVAYAASTWNPTLLVNTESFQTVDEGDGSTNIQIRFGQTLQETITYDRANARFLFSRGIRVNGNIIGTGSLTITRHMSGGSLHVNGSTTLGNNLSVTGSIKATTSITAKSFLSGATLRVSGPADVHGALAASGSVRTDGDLTINDDAGATDAVLTFGNATTNQTLKYLNTAQKFQFSKSISVIGTISGSSLNVDRNATIGGSLTATGMIRTMGTLSGNALTVNRNATIGGSLTATGMVRTLGTLSGNALTVNRNATIGGSLTATGMIRTMGTLSGNALTINRNATVGGTLTATGSIRTKGNLSGSTLTVDGAFNWHGQSYVGPTSQGANTFLKTDGAGNLTWSAAAVGNGSGNIISLHPQYANAVYFASGSTAVGQLTQSGGQAGLENIYRWTSSKTTKNDYWIAVRVRVPDNFSSWDAVKPIEFRYRTGSGQTFAQGQGAYLSVKMLDTSNTPVTLTGGANLANTAYTTANITGPQSAGTFTPKSYFTILIKMAASTTPNGNWFAEAGFLNLNYETTTP